jgi:hypothetical protein
MAPMNITPSSMATIASARKLRLRSTAVSVTAAHYRLFSANRLSHRSFGPSEYWLRVRRSSNGHSFVAGSGDGCALQRIDYVYGIPAMQKR